MAYDEQLADRVREAVQGEPGLTEQRMFGGLAFLVNGHLAVSAGSRGGLLLRCDPADTDRHVGHDHVSRFEMRGRELDGWLHVEAPATESDEDLARWVRTGLDHARSLPPR